MLKNKNTENNYRPRLSPKRHGTIQDDLFGF